MRECIWSASHLHVRIFTTRYCNCTRTLNFLFRTRARSSQLENLFISVKRPILSVGRLASLHTHSQDAYAYVGIASSLCSAREEFNFLFVSDGHDKSVGSPQLWTDNDCDHRCPVVSRRFLPVDCVHERMDTDSAIWVVVSGWCWAKRGVNTKNMH